MNSFIAAFYQMLLPCYSLLTLLSDCFPSLPLSSKYLLTIINNHFNPLKQKLNLLQFLCDQFMNFPLLPLIIKIMTLRQLEREDLTGTKCQKGRIFQPSTSIREKQKSSNRLSNYSSEFSCLNVNHTFHSNEENFEERSPEFFSKQQMSNPFQEFEVKFSFNQEWQTNPNTYRSNQPNESLPQRTFKYQEKNAINCQDSSTTEKRWKESNQTTLQQIQNTMKNQRKASIGSIKKNRKVQEVDNKILCDEFFKNDFDLEEIENIRMSKLTEMNQKLNRVINKQKLSKIREQNKENYDQLDDDNGKCILSQKTPIDQLDTKEEFNQNLIFQIKQLFKKLDTSNIGILSKTNCNFKGIPEQFKFIFGSVFTKIVLKGQVCSQEQFITLCINSLKETDVKQILELFQQKFTENSKDKIEENTVKIQHSLLKPSNLLNKDRINSLFFQKKQKQNPSLQRQIKKRYYEIEEPPLAVKIAEEIDLQPLQRKFYSCSKENNRFDDYNQSLMNQRKKIGGGISESIILEHKKGLKELDDLDKMVSRILNTRQLSKQNDFDGESLSFGELVKHI